MATFTNDDGTKLIYELTHDMQAWGRFLNDHRVQSILFKAIRHSPLQNRISVNDLGNSVFIYTLAENDTWLTSEKKNPGAIFRYFEKTVRSLMKTRKFVKDYLGIDIKMATDPMPDNPLPLPEEDADSSAQIAAGRVDAFQEIIAKVWDSNMVYGELLYRYYVKLDSVRTIAEDFLQRGLMTTANFDGKVISSQALDAAENNVQTRKLNAARALFNKIAEQHDFPYKLEGKIKKSVLKTAAKERAAYFAS